MKKSTENREFIPREQARFLAAALLKKGYRSVIPHLCIWAGRCLRHKSLYTVRGPLD